jgi:Fic family protein
MITQPEGYRAFVPAPLPPDPPLAFDAQLASVLARAGTALGRLDGVAATLPNPNLFVPMYVHREAVLSSQIEGTQSTQTISLLMRSTLSGPTCPTTSTRSSTTSAQ